MGMKSVVFASALLSAVLGASSASASSCTGNCGNLGPDGVVTAPPAGGPTYGYVSSSGGAYGAGQVAGAGGTNGSEYITDLFGAAAGDPLKFHFNYVTSDGAGYSDYAFSELLDAADSHVAWLFTARTTPSGDTSPGFGLPANDSTLSPASTPINPGATTWSPLGGSSGSCWSAGCGNTGWIESTYSIASGGNYKIRFGVTNYGDTAYDSGLAFAGVTVAGNPVPIGGAVPEPATWAMMIGGFGLVGGAMRRRRSAGKLAAA